MKNYAQAATFYKKTLSETPDDQDLKAALYYSYLLSGQNENAAILARTMVPSYTSNCRICTLQDGPHFTFGWISDERKQA